MTPSKVPPSGSFSVPFRHREKAIYVKVGDKEYRLLNQPRARVGRLHLSSRYVGQRVVIEGVKYAKT